MIDYVKRSFKELTRFEWGLLLFSVSTCVLAFLLVPKKDPYTLAASVIGAISLVFIARGNLIGEVLTILFAVFYGIVSFFFRYYGEMLTYLGMTAPMSIVSLVSWAKHPYRKTEVAVGAMTLKKFLAVFLLSAAVTVAFYFPLRALKTANLLVSTLSVFTSFLAVCLTFLRSPYYAVAYASNDVVLLVLWALAAAESISYLPMCVCFAVFLLNDVYGFINWKRMQKRQNENPKASN